ncbi:MAG: RagB/SusD family nutrient uptake outer membrane protein, partial [Bacteroidaceae bacterium]|nr:RagB/SusD family nutrient uptake outer membrane protein [Bacteroidaceae bacterium]
MKNIKNKIFSAATCVAVGFGFTSCDIDLLPLNEVVYENFWTNKDDVESVVASCYTGMMSEGYVEKLMVWGEGRSDNVQIGGASDIPADLRYLLQGSIKTTNGFCSWANMY